MSPRLGGPHAPPGTRQPPGSTRARSWTRSHRLTLRKEGARAQPDREINTRRTPQRAPRARVSAFVASSVVGQAHGDSPPLIIQTDSGYPVYYSYQNLHVTRVAHCAHAVGTEPRTLAMPARSPLHHTCLSDTNPRLRRSWRCIGGKLYLGDSKLAINIKP